MLARQTSEPRPLDRGGELHRTCQIGIAMDGAVAG